MRFQCRIFSRLIAKIWLTLVVVLSFSAASWAQNFSRLPIGVQNLMEDEQTRILTPWGDPMVYADHSSNLENEFRPESRQAFRIKSYWLPETELRVFSGSGFNVDLQSLFRRTNAQGEIEYRLLVHPKSEAFFSEITANASPGESFWGWATASSRTILIWQDGHEEKPFFAKLSLDVVMATRRIMRAEEISRSVGTSDMLTVNRETIAEQLQYFPEVFGITPNWSEGGGMLIRTIPPEIASGQIHVRPLFAMFSDGLNGRPPFVDQILESGLSAKAYFRERFLGPYISGWFESLISEGISSEDHTQNLMWEVGTDVFWRRDMGGFSVDLEHRRAMGKKMPVLQTLHSEFEDFSQEDIARRIGRVPKIHFGAGTIYSIDRLVPLWIERGLLPAEGWPRGYAKDLFYEMVQGELTHRGVAKNSFTLAKDFSNLHLAIFTLRSKAIKESCEKSLGGPG